MHWTNDLDLSNPLGGIVALCINQDDVDERNKQIRVMDRIFREAEQVHAWLGEELATGDSRRMFDLMQSFTQATFNPTASNLQGNVELARLAALAVENGFGEFLIARSFAGVGSFKKSVWHKTSFCTAAMAVKAGVR